MKKILPLLSIAFLLTSCGDSSEIKDLIRLNLKDPESAKFEDITFSDDNKRACVVWNAKNGMGGYGDWEITELKRENSEWTIKNLKGFTVNCNETGFKALDAEEIAMSEASLKAIAMLQKSRNISRDEAHELGTTGACSALVSAYASAYSNIVANRIRYPITTEREEKKDEERLQKLQAKLEAGECGRNYFSEFLS